MKHTNGDTTSRRLTRDQAAALAALAVSGDPSAFEAVYRQYAGVVSVVVRGVLTRPSDDVEAASQDAWLKVWLRLGQFDPARASLSTWIGSVARSTARDWFRAEVCRGLLRRVDGMTREPEAPAGTYDRFEFRDDDAYASVGRLWLRGATYRGIAAAEGIPVGTVKTRIHRFRRSV